MSGESQEIFEVDDKWQPCILVVKRFTDIPINCGLNLKKIEPLFGFCHIGVLQYLNFSCMLQNF